MKITDYELVDHGIDGEQYFPGCGVAFTPFNYVVTGCGDNPAEAYDDATEQMATMPECDGVDFAEFDKRVLKDIGKRSFPRRPFVSAKYGDDSHYYLSIRFNVEK
jgi:hypothetical protein